MGFWSSLYWLWSAYSTIRDAWLDIKTTWHRRDISTVDRIVNILDTHPVFIAVASALSTLLVASVVYVMIRKKARSREKLAVKVYMAACWIAMLGCAAFVGLSTLAICRRLDELRLSLHSSDAALEGTLSALSTHWTALPSSTSKLNAVMRQAYHEWVEDTVTRASTKYSASTSSNQQVLETAMSPFWSGLAGIEQQLLLGIEHMRDCIRVYARADARGKEMLNMSEIVAITEGPLTGTLKAWKEAWAAMQNTVPKARKAMEGCRQDPRMLRRLLLDDLHGQIEKSKAAVMPNMRVDLGAFLESARSSFNGAIRSAEMGLWIVEKEALLFAGLVAAIAVTGFVLSRRKVQKLLVVLAGLSGLLAWEAWRRGDKFAIITKAYMQHCSAFEAQRASSPPENDGNALIMIAGHPITSAALGAFVATCSTKDDLPSALYTASVSTPLFNTFDVDRSRQRVTIEWSKLTGDAPPNNEPFINLVPDPPPCIYSQTTANVFRSYAGSLRSDAWRHMLFRGLLDDLKADIEDCERGAAAVKPPELGVFFAARKEAVERTQAFLDGHKNFGLANSIPGSAVRERYVKPMLSRIEHVQKLDLENHFGKLEQVTKDVCAKQRAILEELERNRVDDTEPKFREAIEHVSLEAEAAFKPLMRCERIAKHVINVVDPLCTGTVPKAQSAESAFRLQAKMFVGMAGALILASRIIDWTIRRVWAFLWKYLLGGSAVMAIGKMLGWVLAAIWWACIVLWRLVTCCFPSAKVQTESRA